MCDINLALQEFQFRLEKQKISLS